MEILTPADYGPESRRRRRQRSGRPCDACRRRKTRCVVSEEEGRNGGGEPCVHCRLRGSACTFNGKPPSRLPSAIRRGASSSSPARRLSEANAQTQNAETPSNRLQMGRNGQQQQQSTEPSSSPAREKNHYDDHQQQPMPNGDKSPALPLPSPSTNNNPSDAKEEDPITQGLPGDETPTMGFDLARFAELYGLGSDMEPILMRHRPYNVQTQEFSLETHAIRRVLQRDTNGIDTVEYPVTFHMVADSRALAPDPDDSRAETIEACVRPHGPRLVELFWRHVQPCYPLLHKVFFMQHYEKNEATRRKLGAELLGAVYLSALRWWTYDPELSIRTMPDAARLRRLLHEAIAAAYHRPKLSAIQAILLLLQCQPEDPLNPDHSYAWGLTCQALAIGQCVGLHLDASQWAVPAWERHVRKRLSWALFMQDRWTALAYGRPVHLHEDDWGVQPLTDEDFADCDRSTMADERRSISATGKLQFVLMVQLAQILSRVLSQFYTMRASLDQDTVRLYRRAGPLLEELQAWYQSIPASLQMTISYQRKLSFHGHLHFSYYGVQIALLRRLIRSTALAPRCADDQVLSALRQLGLQTAQSAIGFVIGLRADQLEAFWYFASPYLFSLVGSFATLLLVTSLSSPERSFWQETLNSCLWHLRTMSKSSEPMRYAVNRLEGAILRGLEHALAVNLHEPQDDNESPILVGDVQQNMSQHIQQQQQQQLNPPPQQQQQQQQQQQEQEQPMLTFTDYTDFGDWDLVGDGGFAGSFDLLSMTFPS